MDSLAVPSSEDQEDIFFLPFFRKQFIIFSIADTVVQGFFHEHIHYSRDIHHIYV